MFVDKLSSPQNPKIKDIVSLSSKSRERRLRDEAVVEGYREFERALEGGFQPESVFFCDKFLKDHKLLDRLGGRTAVYEVTPEIYGKIAFRSDTEGIVSVIHTPRLKLEDITLSGHPLVLVLESVEKPGNIGAVLRTADAAGVDAVIVCDPLSDLFNPNVIRASLGAIFSVPTTACTSEEAFNWLFSNSIQILTAQLQNSSLYYHTDMTRPTAIVMGTEDKGLTDFWREKSDARIRIPMYGMMDSLNVSVAAAILCFEAVRQRGSLQ